MKLPNYHVVTRKVGDLSTSIEREFFRIERENRTLSAAINALIAGVAVGLVAWLFNESNLLLFACLGSSASSIVFAPLAKANSLRSILLSYLTAILVCVLLEPLNRNELLHISYQCFLAVSVSVFVARMIDALHPAAVGSAMAFIIYERDAKSLFTLMLAILGLLTIVKVLAYMYLEELAFKDFRREFQRHYYGREVLLTVSNDDSTTCSGEEEESRASVQ